MYYRAPRPPRRSAAPEPSAKPDAKPSAKIPLPVCLWAGFGVLLLAAHQAARLVLGVSGLPAAVPAPGHRRNGTGPAAMTPVVLDSPLSTTPHSHRKKWAVVGGGVLGMELARQLRAVGHPVTLIEAAPHLGGLAELRILGLASTQCNGTGFQHLKALKKLESVNFHFTPLNDDGLRAIAQVPISGRLWFAHTRFTDEGAASLKNLTQLKRCGIGSADKGSSGEAVAALEKLPLEDLALLDNQATPAGLAHATKIATLRRLDVSHAPGVKDESMPLVSQMPALEEFKLGSAQVTDDGLQLLAASKSLKKLSLSGLKGITPMGISKLRNAQPKWMIEVN